MKYTPKNVFILEDGRYKEISYEEHHKLQKIDKAYADKLFLLLHGSLMEVTEDTYRIYHKTRRRQKYIDECSYKNRDFSYDSLDTEEMLGEDIFADESIDVEKQVEDKMMISLLYKAIKLLPEEDKKLLRLHFFQNLSENKLAEMYGISQQAINKRLRKIYDKIKIILES